MNDLDPQSSLPEFPPYRPPSEADSVLVRVTRGCKWNRCEFCGMYSDVPFERRALDEVLRDVAAWGELHPRARSVFLADADSLLHPELVEIVREVRRVFPRAERVTSYVRLTTLRRRTTDELAALREAGLTRLHAGLESGSERVLARVKKALRPELAIEGARRAMEAGFELSLYILCGLGGEDDWEEHGRASGRVVASIGPHFLRLRSRLLFPGTPLHHAWQAGTFHPASPVTRLREARVMLEELVRNGAPSAGGPPRETRVCSDHFSNVVWADRRQVFAGLDGRLPGDEARLFATVERALAAVEAATEVADPASLARAGRLPGAFGAVAPAGGEGACH